MTGPFTQSIKERRYGVVCVTNKLLYSNPDGVQNALSKLLILATDYDQFHHHTKYKFSHPCLDIHIRNTPLLIYSFQIRSDVLRITIGETIYGEINL